MAERKTPDPDDLPELPRTGGPPAPMTVLVNNQLVCVVVGDASVPERRDGMCNCGACEGGRHPDSAADYF